LRVGLAGSSLNNPVVVHSLRAGGQFRQVSILCGRPSTIITPRSVSTLHDEHSSARACKRHKPTRWIEPNHYLCHACNSLAHSAARCADAEASTEESIGLGLYT